MLAVAATLAAGGAAQAQTINLASLHDALHLTPVQEDAWRAYGAAISPDPSADARRSALAAMIPKLPTPRRIDLVTAALSEDLAAFRRQGEAVKRFYTALTPEQQTVFDRQTLQLGTPAPR